MTFRGDERGAAIQIGAMILFAFIVIAMASYQATVVPSQNSGVEFNHNQDVQSQMVDLTNGIDASAREGTRGSHSVRLGTTYPSRTFFVNPGSPSGQLRTVENGEIAFDGVTIDDADNVQTFWTDRDSITTNRLQYEPNYNEYRNAPTTVYEHGELINDNPRGSPTTLASGDLVDDGELSLITLRGEVQAASSSTVTVPRRSLSSSGNTVTVTDGTITLPISERHESYWVEELEEYDELSDVAASDGAVQFDVDDELDLRMAEVGVGSVTRGEPEDRAAYLYQVNTATVEVRDRFNNPVEGATVEIDGDEETSDSDGRVSVGANRVGDEIDWSIDGSTVDEKTLTTTVDENDVGAEAGGSVGTSTYDIEWSEPQPDGNVEPGDTADYEVVRGAGDSIFLAETIPGDINGANVDFYYRDRDNTGISIKSEDTEFTDGTAEVEIRDFDELGEFDLFVASGGHEERITVEVISDATGTLEGQITEPDGSPLETEEVTISGDGIDETVMTDGDGNYDITDVLTGTYEDVTANANGFGESEPATFEVNEDETTEQDFQLTDATDASLEITDVSGLEDGTPGTTYDTVDVTVDEQNGVATEGLVVTLSIDGDTEGNVYEDTIDADDITASSETTVTFTVDDQFPKDEYTYTTTADAENAEEVSEQGSFTVNNAANSVEQVGTPVATGNNNAGVDFDIGNTGDTQVMIDSISIESTTTVATRINDQNSPEVTIGGTEALNLDSGDGIEIGGKTESLDTSVSIDPESELTVALRDFEEGDGDGRGTRVDMSGEEIDLTLYFADGSQRSYTIVVD
ncbi:carboxypeptidase-like regulatory domain-containing protein [Natranaeroarchaeum sulfidigenes]|uniref:Putative surface protein, possible component of pili like system n=1 Tax=Natranaeroarchaeum sulfidigenes TaxID=2784880 RepID=A0A897MSG8_9EURY|nr:carboxypeptidase-like regulatory domain-containing protein [Natranaeroarchaeum sulfidigenes]QSG01963.1 putative surface protein, possible component of pili like system [Natranaeroarchaeum sulfidigenes]